MKHKGRKVICVLSYIFLGAVSILLIGEIVELGFVDKRPALVVALAAIWLGVLTQRAIMATENSHKPLSDESSTEDSTRANNWYSDEVNKLKKSLEARKDDDILGFLATSRREMHDALDKFFARVQNFVGFYIAIFTLVAGILYFWLKDEPDLIPPPFAAALICFLAYCFGSYVARPGMHSLYELYVASVIYASQLHEAMGIENHRWFDYVREYASKKGSSKIGVIESWMDDQGPSNYTSSRKLISFFTIASFMATVGLLLWGLLEHPVLSWIW